MSTTAGSSTRNRRKGRRVPPMASGFLDSAARRGALATRATADNSGFVLPRILILASYDDTNQKRQFNAGIRRAVCLRSLEAARIG